MPDSYANPGRFMPERCKTARIGLSKPFAVFPSLSPVDLPLVLVAIERGHSRGGPAGLPWHRVIEMCRPNVCAGQRNAQEALSPITAYHTPA